MKKKYRKKKSAPPLSAVKRRPKRKLVKRKSSPSSKRKKRLTVRNYGPLTVQNYGPRVSSEDTKKLREEQTPDECPIFNIPIVKSVLDHDHQSGKIRGVLSNEANLWLGKLENNFRRYGNKSSISTIEALENVLNYLKRQDLQENYGARRPYHYIGLVQVVKRFSALKAPDQISKLKQLGSSDDEIRKAKNSRKRCNLYRKTLIQIEIDSVNR